jgi:hypothetical protein
MLFSNLGGSMLSFYSDKQATTASGRCLTPGA